MTRSEGQIKENDVALLINFMQIFVLNPLMRQTMLVIRNAKYAVMHHKYFNY